MLVNLNENQNPPRGGAFPAGGPDLDLRNLFYLSGVLKLNTTLIFVLLLYSLFFFVLVSALCILSYLLLTPSIKMYFQYNLSLLPLTYIRKPFLEHLILF